MNIKFESGPKWTVKMGESERSWVKLDGHLDQRGRSRAVLDVSTKSGRSTNVKVDGLKIFTGDSGWSMKMNVPFWVFWAATSLEPILVLTLKLVLSKLLILDRELPPDDEHLKNPADITKVDPIFKGKIDTDNRRSTIYLNTEDHLTCSSSTSNIIVDDSTVSKPNLKESLEKTVA